LIKKCPTFYSACGADGGGPLALLFFHQCEILPVSENRGLTGIPAHGEGRWFGEKEETVSFEIPDKRH